MPKRLRPFDDRYLIAHPSRSRARQMTRALDDIDSSEGSEGEAEERGESVRQPASISPVAAPAASAVPLGSLESKAARAELHARVASAGYAVLRRPRAAVAARDARAAVDALCSAFPPEAIARAHGAGDGPGQKHGYMSFLEEGFEVRASTRSAAPSRQASPGRSASGTHP